MVLSSLKFSMQVRTLPIWREDLFIDDDDDDDNDDDDKFFLWYDWPMEGF